MTNTNGKRINTCRLQFLEEGDGLENTTYRTFRRLSDTMLFIDGVPSVKGISYMEFVELKANNVEGNNLQLESVWVLKEIK
jgi:hypothetical protein